MTIALNPAGAGRSELRRSTSKMAVVFDRLATLCWGATRLLRLPPRSILTTIRVVALMALVELMVRRSTLPRVAAILRVRLDLHPSPLATVPLDVATLSTTAQRQITCTNRVADAWPFSDGPCLRRTLVAGRLLRSLDPAIRIGLRNATAASDMVAHAWIEIDGQPLEDISDVGAFALSQVT